jgi:mono/diheme cytochrome c family protein
LFRPTVNRPMGNERFRWFVCGALAVCLAGLLCLAAFLEFAHGFSAREEPSATERWIARRARMAALPSDAAKIPNPEVLAEARAHWADHCASCHANDGSGESLMGRRTYPPAPDMRRPETQQLTDGELFYIIQNGIRLTAMPAWAGPGSGSHHDAEDSWKLVRFIRHIPKLTAEEEAEMQELNPKSPDEFKEEQEEKEFLNGDQSHEHTPQHERH